MIIYGAEALANHIGTNIDSVRDCEYQAGQYTQKTFYIDDAVWSPYQTKAKEDYEFGF